MELPSDRASMPQLVLEQDAGGNTDPFLVAVRSTHMPMAITDARQPDNPIVFVNDAFCRLTGYAADEVVGRLEAGAQRGQ